MEEWFNMWVIRNLNGNLGLFVSPSLKLFGTQISLNHRLMDFALWMEEETIRLGKMMPFFTLTSLQQKILFGVIKESCVWPNLDRKKEDSSAFPKAINSIMTISKERSFLISKITGSLCLNKIKEKNLSIMF